MFITNNSCLLVIFQFLIPKSIFIGKSNPAFNTVRSHIPTTFDMNSHIYIRLKKSSCYVLNQINISVIDWVSLLEIWNNAFWDTIEHALYIAYKPILFANFTSLSVG